MKYRYEKKYNKNQPTIFAEKPSKIKGLQHLYQPLKYTVIKNISINKQNKCRKIVVKIKTAKRNLDV